MANKTKGTPQKEETREKGPESPDAPLPLLDLSGAAVTKMIKQAKKRGYVTYEQLSMRSCPRRRSPPPDRNAAGPDTAMGRGVSNPDAA